MIVRSRPMRRRASKLHKLFSNNELRGAFNPWTCIIQSLREMEDAPVASLSLTHVHYVSRLWTRFYRLCSLTAFTESTRSHILFIGMAGSCSTGALCHIRDIDLGIKRSRDLPNVRWSNGM
jgi:hypothetical protein